MLEKKIKTSPKRYIVDIGSEGDVLLKEMQRLTKKRKLTKGQIIQLSLEYCKLMNVNFNEPIQKSITVNDLEKVKNQIVKQVNEMLMMFTNQLTPIINKLNKNDIQNNKA